METAVPGAMEETEPMAVRLPGRLTSGTAAPTTFPRKVVTAGMGGLEASAAEGALAVRVVQAATGPTVTTAQSGLEAAVTAETAVKVAMEGRVALEVKAGMVVTAERSTL